MEIKLIPLDYDYFNFNNKDYIRIVGKTQEGKRVCLIDDFEIYFFAIFRNGINQNKAKEICEEIGKIKDKENTIKIEKVQLVNMNFLGKKVLAAKIFLNSFKNINKIIEKIDSKDIQHFREHDINIISKYIIEKKLIPSKLSLVKGSIIADNDYGGIGGREGINADFILKIESISELKEDEKNIFVPSVLAFDIETSEFEIGKGEILMISLVSNDFKKVLTFKKIDKKIDYVEVYKNEKEMLSAFVDYFKKINPDILTGYYSDGFDLPYIKARCVKNKVKLDLGIDGSALKFSGGNKAKGKIFGIIHIDLFNFIQTAYSQYLQSETLGLSEVSSELLGEKKIEFEFKPSIKMSQSDWEKFFEYNLWDSSLTFKLFHKAWPDLSEFSIVMQEPLFNVSRDGMSSNVENYLIHNIRRYNEIIQEKPPHNEISQRMNRERYEGAFVLQPIPNLYENIVMFDFTSYWPSIISTFNLSLSTYLGDNKIKDALEVDSGKEKYYFSKEKGFFPLMLEEIIKKRKQYKEEYKKNPSPILQARSNAFKLLANASYGYQGFFAARYYCPQASASATALSRKFIKEVIEKANNFGMKAIYSDTDSVCLSLGNKGKKEALSFLEKINKQLPGIMELELEDFYQRGIWVTTRNGEFGAKKKYALINYDGKMKIRGFETVRRDWCMLARELQNKVLYMILKNGNEKEALEYTRKIIDDVKKRKVDKKSLIIKTMLKKPLSEYKANTPHVTIARKMIQAGIPVDQGMLIEYFIAQGVDKKALTRDRAVFVDENKDFDIKYYLEKQLLPAVENIFGVFGIDINNYLENSKQKTLF